MPISSSRAEEEEEEGYTINRVRRPTAPGTQNATGAATTLEPGTNAAMETIHAVMANTAATGLMLTAATIIKPPLNALRPTPSQPLLQTGNQVTATHSSVSQTRPQQSPTFLPPSLLQHPQTHTPILISWTGPQ